MSAEQKNELLKDNISQKLSLYDAEKQNRVYAYSKRLEYYSGAIKPTVGTNHEQISTNLAATIADKLAAYTGTNCFDINITAKDITKEEDNEAAQLAENIAKEMFEASDYEQWFLEANEVASRMGDGLVVMDKRDGIPYSYSIQKPENVTFGWRTDNYKELDWWSYEFGITPEQALERFGEAFPATSDMDNLEVNVVSDREGSSIYQIAKDLITNRRDSTPKFVKITDFHTYVELTDKEGKQIAPANTNIVMANNKIVEVNEGKAKKLYHFIANTYPTLPTGVCDFEHVAENITVYEKKLSEEADAISQKVYHKFITNSQKADSIKSKLQFNKPQLIQLQDEEKLEVLRLDNSSYDSEPLIKNLLNIIRTVSGLQELGQDQISPNISGRALTMVFQGVIQVVTKKRIRWEKIVRDMTVDALWEVADSKMKKAFFDEDGNFKFNINVLWADVLESDKASKIANIVNLRAGTEPIISAMTARQMADIPDPTMEEKRINLEMDRNIQRQQALSGSVMAPSENTPTLSEDQNQGEGIGSAPGQAGTAQTAGMSMGAANAMSANNSGGQ